MIRDKYSAKKGHQLRRARSTILEYGEFIR